MSRAEITRLTWFDRTNRSRVEIAGPDRAKFLHNLTTNDVKRLAAGTGHEAFITSPQGKTLAYITNLGFTESIWLRTDPEVLGSLMPHLAKYGVFDDVTVTDRSAETWEYHLCGPDAASVVTGWDIDPATLTRSLAHREIQFQGQPIWLIREDVLGTPGWTLIGPIAERDGIRGWLADQGSEGDAALLEALRIEAWTPASGRDVTANNLPQEIGRDDRTINFVKGCYLGQETVARLDALGHVNRILRGGWIEGTSDVPPAGTSLVDEGGKIVGEITSAAFSPRRDAPVWLGYLRVAQSKPGSRLKTSLANDRNGVAVVAEVPKPVEP